MDVELRDHVRDVVRSIEGSVPDGRLGLRPGVDPAVLDDFEEELGQALPDDLREFWLFTDGQAPGPTIPLFVDLIAAPVNELRKAWGGLQLYVTAGEASSDHRPRETDERIGPTWFSPSRIPLTYGRDGLQVDLAPAAGGSVGQVIDQAIEHGTLTYVAASVIDLLEGIAVGLSTGRCVLRDLGDAGGLRMRWPESTAPSMTPSAAATLARVLGVP